MAKKEKDIAYRKEEESEHLETLWRLRDETMWEEELRPEIQRKIGNDQVLSRSDEMNINRYGDFGERKKLFAKSGGTGSVSSDLRISHPDDSSEKEADTIAKEVSNGGNASGSIEIQPKIQRQEIIEENDEVVVTDPYEVTQVGTNIHVKITAGKDADIVTKEKDIDIAAARKDLIDQLTWNGVVNVMKKLDKDLDSFSYTVPTNIHGNAADDVLIVPDAGIKALVERQAKYYTTEKSPYKDDLKKYLADKTVTTKTGTKTTNPVMDKITGKIKVPHSHSSTPSSDVVIEPLGLTEEQLMNEGLNTNTKDPDDGTKDIPKLDFGAAEDVLYDTLRKIVISKNGLWSDENKIINIVGVRRSEPTKSTGKTYNDTLAVCWKDDTLTQPKCVRHYIATTEAGNPARTSLTPSTVTMIAGTHHSQGVLAFRTKNIYAHRDRPSAISRGFHKDIGSNIHPGGNDGYQGWSSHAHKDYGFNFQSAEESSPEVFNAWVLFNKILYALYEWQTFDYTKAAYANLEALKDGKKIEFVSRDAQFINVKNATTPKAIDIKAARTWTVGHWIAGEKGDRRNNLLEILQSADSAFAKPEGYETMQQAEIEALVTDEIMEKIVKKQIDYYLKIDSIDGNAGDGYYNDIVLSKKEKLDDYLARAKTAKETVDALLEQSKSNPNIKDAHRTYLKQYKGMLERELKFTQNSDNFVKQSDNSYKVDENIGMGEHAWSTACTVVYGGGKHLSFMQTAAAFVETTGQRRWYYTIIDADTLTKDASTNTTTPTGGGTIKEENTTPKELNTGDANTKTQTQEVTPAPTPANLNNENQNVNPGPEADKIQRKKDTPISDSSNLSISQPGDEHEKEADDIAKQVVSGGENIQRKANSGAMQFPTVNRKEADEMFESKYPWAKNTGTPDLLRKESDGEMRTTADFDAQLNSSKSGGQSMDDSTKSEMESKMGSDFSDVKIHTDSNAHGMSQDINAKAFTHGQDIYFKDGQYNPGSEQGKELLAHELVHTQQQAGVNRKIQRQVNDYDPGKDADEIIAKHTKNGVVEVEKVGEDLYAPMAASQEEVVTGVLDKLKKRLEKFMATFALMRKVMNNPPVARMSQDLSEKLLNILYSQNKVGYPSIDAAIEAGNMENFLEEKVKVGYKHVTDWSAKIKAKHTPNTIVLDKNTTDTIEANRGKIPDHSAKLKWIDQPDKGHKGHQYMGKDPKGKDGKALAPKDTTSGSGNSKIKQQIYNVVWKEVGKGEGALSAIVTYDDQVFSWGKGFAGGATLAPIIAYLFNADAKNKNHKFSHLFLDQGIYATDKDIYIVNTTSGPSYGNVAEPSGGSMKNVLQLIKDDKRLMSFFIDLAEDKDTAPDVLDAQWEQLKANAANIPPYVHDDKENYKEEWSDAAVALTSHLSHWLSAGSWKNNSYEATKGNIRKIVARFFLALNARGAALQGKTKKHILAPTDASGAIIAGTYADFYTHLNHFGVGADNRGVAIKAIANDLYTIPADVLSSTAFKDYILIPKSGDQYYALPKDMNADEATSRADFKKALDNAIAESKKPKQKKSLEINHPQDEYEKEADEVASKVVNGESAEIKGNAQQIQRKGEDTAKVTPEFNDQLAGSKGDGQSLPENLQNELGGKMNADLGDVKIHTGSNANAMSENINAKAFTHEQDVYFGAGNYNPDSKDGKELLAHELVHTQQQQNGVMTKIQRAPLAAPEVDIKIDGEINKVVISDSEGNALFTKKYSKITSLNEKLTWSERYTGEATVKVTTSISSYTGAAMLTDENTIAANFTTTAPTKADWQKTNKTTFEAIQNGDDSVINPLIKANEKTRDDKAISTLIPTMKSIFGLTSTDSTIDKPFVVNLADWQFENMITPTGKLSDLMSNNTFKRIFFNTYYSNSTEASLKATMDYGNTKLTEMVTNLKTTDNELLLIKSYLGNVTFINPQTFDRRDTLLLAMWQLDNGYFPTGYIDAALLTVLQGKVAAAATNMATHGFSDITKFSTYTKEKIADPNKFATDLLARTLVSNSDYAYWILDAARLGFLTLGGRAKEDLAQIALELDFKQYEIQQADENRTNKQKKNSKVKERDTKPSFSTDWSTKGDVLNGMLMLQGMLKTNIETWKNDLSPTKTKRGLQINSLATWNTSTEAMSRRTGTHGDFSAMDFDCDTVDEMNELLAMLPNGSYAFGIPWQKEFYVDFANRYTGQSAPGPMKTKVDGFKTTCNTAKANVDEIDELLKKLENLDTIVKTPTISQAIFGANAAIYTTQIDILVKMNIAKTTGPAKTTQVGVVQGIVNDIKVSKTTNENTLSTNKTSLESLVFFVKYGSAVLSPSLGTWDAKNKAHSVTYPEIYRLTMSDETNTKKYITADAFDGLKAFNLKSTHSIDRIFSDNSGHLHTEAVSIT